MRVVNTVADLRTALAGQREYGRLTGPGLSAEGRRGTIALVPTMGYLHEGHLTLVDLARTLADCVVLSIFVNPLQFGPREDLATYPRDLERDVELARDRAVDLVFAPAETELYPHEQPRVTLVAPSLTNRLCGRFRPGHFEGVLTVVAKLFNIVQPDVAVFGQKDFQQSVLIRQMVTDLDFPVRIAVAPIVREPDGLAMSSRNVYLTAEARTSAVSLNRALQAARAAFTRGERAAEELRAVAQHVLGAAPGVEVQYLELVDAERLEPVSLAEPGNVMAVAAFVGATRLIDNLVLA